MPINKLILGDNLEILKSIEADSIDLIYLDPPFFSNHNYEVIWGDAGEIRSFQDRWSGGIDHYIGWLKERVEEMRRVLKPTGSIFLHCDWHANAEIKVEILNKIFDSNNFKGEIIWKRTSAHSNAKGLGNSSDSIFYYTKSDDNIYNQLYHKYDDAYIESHYNNVDENGKRFMPSDLGGHRGINKIYEWKGIEKPWRYPKERLDKLDKEGRIFWTKNGTPRYKRFLEDMSGIPLQNIWTDIYVVNSQAKEAIGYPTQKPEALLERIIKMASNEGDTVLDPFMGGGTAIAVADKLNRRWLGIDQPAMAVKVTELRLQKQQDLFSAPYAVQLHKYDYDTLRYKDAFAFEAWIVRQFGGTPNAKQRGDMGLDGKAADGAPVQVKRSDNIGRSVIDNFKSAAERFDKNLFDKNIAAQKPIGYIIAFSFGKGAVEEVARLKNKEDRIIKLVTVESIVPIAVKPAISVHISELGKDEKGVRRIEFAAAGESPAGIEFYSWDFAYDAEKGFKPEVFIDKEGKQIYSCKAGLYHIAVKVVDNDGLENINHNEIQA